MKLIDRPSQPIPAAPRGLVYWSNRKIDSGLRNTAALASDELRRSFGKDVQGTASFNVVDGSATDEDRAAPADPAVPGTEQALRIQPSQVRKVANPDPTVDEEMPATGAGVIGKFASHSTIGEDASFAASLSGAVTNEPVSATRIAVDAILSANPGMSYRTASQQHAANLAAAAARQAAKAGRNRRRRTR